jgi:DNA-directed RNA polymerase III subunit RPC5
MADDDEVVRELDVYINDAELDLFLLQFPLKPIYADPPNIPHARFKARHRKLEMEIPFVTAPILDGDPKDRTINQRFQSMTVARETSLAAGVIKDNAMHITPIQDVVQMRPSFRNMNTGADIEYISDNEQETSGEQPVEQIQMKRRETEKTQSARAQSYSYLQAQEETEPWLRLQVHPAG